MVKKLQSSDPLHIAIVAVVAINMILTIGLYTREVVAPNYAREMEVLKAGGEENFAILEELYSSDEFAESQKESLEAALAQFEGGSVDRDTGSDDSSASAGSADTQFPTGTLSQSEISDILDGVPFKGNADAKIVWIEYTDLECPFCQRHHNAGTSQDMLDQFGDDLGFVVKHFPLSFHPNAQKASEGAYCVNQEDGADAYYEYLDQVLRSQDATLSNITEIGGGLVGEADFTSCLDGDEFSAKVLADMREGQETFGVSGTPGNVLLNTETGDWTVVSGAYPANDFEREIQRLLDM